MYQLIKALTELHGPCGHEQEITRYIREKTAELADSVEVDAVGNVICRTKGSQPGPRVIVTAHMDEVGFVIKKIEENGLLRFEKLGGHDDRILLAQKVEVTTEQGHLRGIIGTISAHYMKFDNPDAVRKHKELYIDIGASSKSEAELLGVQVGDIATWCSETEYLGSEKTGRIVGKGFDDRAGCAVLIRVLQELKNRDFAGEVIALFSVQEEVGLRGASIAANHIEADAAIAVDTTAVSDTPESTMDNSLKLGDGTGIKIMDFSLIAHPAIKKTLVNLAREREISFQREVFPGIGTDGGALILGGRGIPTGVLSIPSRYAHSPVEVIDMGDLQATVDLLLSFIESLSERSSFTFL
ncbi:M42 family metallopeptidase [Fictibacillus enclensis]|uniref:M42 family metallopeptidase n=1 Tax=Fictibacillus enclensis TaxID=1017270 RepID=UPI0025A16F6C|nr:M42 family metallopeptidase [Fictibacillus enclensis]MDM5197919.1 M42 family metallopeptidase [Fictibacillus enclensis]